ncbi:MAG: hypothetical protein RMI94_12625 [Bryobacterales bacterium]|nr:hypothetical protein [Bryobacteraceae bacterium]MDW8131387.1 hypothetical protein [Bryobacterales bacterium]
MNRRRWFQAVWALPAGLFAVGVERVRGILEHDAEGEPVLRTRQGERIRLEGDDDTMKVLRDKRLAARELEVRGAGSGRGRFRAGPFYEENVLVIEAGKGYLVTYWCDVCSIRSYTPGLCVCCYQETQLDLRPLDSPP